MKPPICPAARDRSRPNILWICTDSQRWDTLGCTGNRLVRTPHLDALAAAGTLFTNCYAQSPLCTPSRAAFLTGRYPVTNRLRQNGQVCPGDLRPIVRDLRDAGWATGLVGKLHLNPCDNRLQLGAEWWREPASRWSVIGGEARIDDGYQEFAWDHAPGNAARGSAYRDWLSRRGATYATTPRPDCAQVLTGMPVADHQSTWCAETAVSFIERHAGQPYPWLLSVNCFDPHYPFDPPAELLEPWLTRLDEIPDPPVLSDELADKPAEQREWLAKHAGYRGLDRRQHRLLRAAYWAMIELLDRQVGRLVEALRRSGQLDDTLILFHSDHGEMLGDHGIYTKDAFFYDGAVRVPLIAAWPGRIRAGQVVDGLVELADIAPTIIEACGLPPDPGMQARSLWGALRDAASWSGRDDVVCEFYGGNPKRSEQPGPRFATMLRTATRKLVRFHGRGEGELYDLETDPGEHRNRWADPAWSAERARLTERLADRIAWFADPLPERVGVF